METSQEVDHPLERGNSMDDRETDPGGDSDLSNTEGMRIKSELSEIKWEKRGESISTVVLPRKRYSSHIVLGNNQKNGNRRRDSPNIFTFSNTSLEQASSEDPLTLDFKSVHSLSISTHSIHSPREKRKVPSSPIHNRSRSSRSLLSSTSTSTIPLKAVSFRRNRPCVTASWIQSKSSSIRNTWSSRNHTVLPVTLVAPNSECCSPQLDTSDMSLDIIVKPPSQYISHRCQLDESNPIQIPSPHFEKNYLELEPCSPIVLSRNQSISPFDRESVNDSWLAESPLPPYISTARLLNVSHDLSPDELEPPSESLYINVSSSRRPLPSILPSLISSDGHLAGTHLDSSPYETSPNSQEWNDFFNFPDYSDHIFEKSEEEEEDITERFTHLMNEQNNEKNQLLRGEELQGGQVSSDDDLIPSGYFDHPSPQIETIVISPMSEESITSSQESILLEPTPVISRDPTPIPLPDSSTSEEEEEVEEVLEPLPPPPDFTSMDICEMINYVISSPMNLDSTSISSIPPSPPPPSPSIPLVIPKEVHAAPIEEKRAYEPTDVQIELVKQLEKERELRIKEREEEEERKKQHILESASEERLRIMEKRNQTTQAKLQMRGSSRQMNVRLSAFSYLFGDCAFLLLPYIRIFDTIFGPVLKPTDDLLHVDQVIIEKIKEGMLDYSSFAQRLNAWNRQGMVEEVQENRYLQSMFKSFSFYYQCTLNYTYKKVTCYM